MDRIAATMAIRRTLFHSGSLLPSTSNWFKFKQFEVYLRIGKTCLAYDYVLAVTISNISVVPKHQRRGVFKKFLEDLKQMSIAEGYTHLFVENVINEHLREYLVSLNFEVCPANDLSLYIKL